MGASMRRTFLVRAVQLLPAARYTAAEKGARLALGAHAEHSLALQVHAGATLEVTLAQVRSGGCKNRPAWCLTHRWKSMLHLIGFLQQASGLLTCEAATVSNVRLLHPCQQSAAIAVHRSL